MTLFRLPACIALMPILVLTLSACGEKNEPEQPSAYMATLFCNTLKGDLIPTVAEVNIGFPARDSSRLLKNSKNAIIAQQL